MRTESATFPFDIKVATFDAWPPGQHETKITPVARGADNFKVYNKKILTNFTKYHVYKHKNKNTSVPNANPTNNDATI